MTQQQRELKREAKRYTDSTFPFKYRPTDPKWWPQTFVMQRVMERIMEQR